MWEPSTSLGLGTAPPLGRWSTRGLMNSGFVVQSLTILANSSSICWARAREQTAREENSKRIVDMVNEKGSRRDAENAENPKKYHAKAQSSLSSSAFQEEFP